MCRLLVRKMNLITFSVRLLGTLLKLLCKSLGCFADGVNEVKVTMQLMVRLITDEMLFSSVTVRLNDMTKEAFLSPLLSYFIEGLSVIIPCRKDNIYVFSILVHLEYNNYIFMIEDSSSL